MRKSRWWKVSGIDSGELVENRKQRAGVWGEFLTDTNIYNILITLVIKQKSRRGRIAYERY